MKKILTAILLLTYTVAFSQTDQDLTEIIEVMIAEYQSDTIIVYNRFKNDELLSALERADNDKYIEIHEKYKTKRDTSGIEPNLDDIIAELSNDTVKIENIKVEFFPAEKVIDKKDNKRIRRYTKIKLKKNKNKPVAYISFPLLSIDRKRAIVYGDYVCGGLCGSGGIFYLEKIKGKWQVVDYGIRWIS